MEEIQGAMVVLTDEDERVVKFDDDIFDMEGADTINWYKGIA